MNTSFHLTSRSVFSFSFNTIIKSISVVIDIKVGNYYVVIFVTSMVDLL
jgi:hypothetical protein